MSNPITWQNVQGRSPAEALQPLLASQGSINGAFDAFQNILAQREAVDAANRQSQQDGARQMFLSALQAAKTPEELAALRASGQLDQFRSGLDANNRTKLLDAEDQRLAGIRQGIVTSNDFNASQRALAEAPLADALKTRIALGDTAGVRAELPGASLANKSGIAATLAAAEQAAVQRAREAKTFDRTNRLGALNLSGAERGEVDAVRANEEATSLRALNDEVAKRAQQHRQEGEFKPDLKAAIKEAMRTGKPVQDFTPKSDTEAADKALEDIAKSGKFSARLLEAQRANIRGAFASNGLNGLVGTDAAKRDVANAEKEVAFDESDKNNWYAPGSPNARRNYDELAKDIPSLIDKTTGLDAEEDIGPLQDLITELGTVGLEVEKGVFVSPSANDVRAAIRGAEGGWFRDAKRAENVKDKLLEMTKKSVFKQMIKEGEQSTEYRRKQAVKKILGREPESK
jgi:hypothetical protein